MSVRRTGIDLSPTRCVVVDAGIAAEKTPGEPAVVRVDRFAVCGAASPTLADNLTQLDGAGEFPRHAWVTLWGVRASHQYIQAPVGREEEFRAVALRHAAAALGMSVHELCVADAIDPAGVPGEPNKVGLSLFAAAAADIRSRLRSVQDAGFEIDGVVTPSAALWSQARLRRATLPGEAHAYVALGAEMSAIAIVGNGFLLSSRELHWGYADPRQPPTAEPVPLDREEIAERLSLELKRSFLYVKQFWPEDVSHVLLCGDMPHLRSLTAPLIERLQIEVETLDSLDGIDATALPDPAEPFIEQTASMRLASAVAAQPPPINLLPSQPAEAVVDRRWTIAAAAAIVGVVGLAAFLHARADVRAREAERRVTARQEEVAGLRQLSARAASEAVPEALARVETLQPPVEMAPAAEAVEVVEAPPRRPAVRDVQAVADAPAIAEPIVRTILFSSQQRSALVDGRIVRVGDSVGEGIVSSIEADAVVLVTAGRARRLALQRPQVKAVKQ